MRTIALEEHFATPTFVEDPGRGIVAQAEAVGFTELPDRLLALDERRITAMDAAGVDVQVLSLTAPGVEQLDPANAVPLARDTNDVLADAVRRHPTRLAGFATLPTCAPDAAADELERAVREYGFKGALINGHSNGRYLDDEFFWPILERAEALDVPIYLHPTPPPQAVIDAYYTGNFPTDLGMRLATAGWGWHIETAVHALRLVLSGAFDRYPRLQLVVGHMGESLPFMLPRLEQVFASTPTLQRSFGTYLVENVHYTFAGFNWTPTFLNLLLQVGAARIMFATDHPYGSMQTARAFLDQLPVSPADKERIAHGNAERLLRIDPTG